MPELKNGLEVDFPLSDRALAVLDALPRTSVWVFPQTNGDEPITHPHGLRNVLRPHDCRRLFTTAARRAELPEYIIDQLRGDAAGTTADGYDRGAMAKRHADRIAAQIEIECGRGPDSTVVRIAS